jgi:hypothetical protein
MGGEIDREREHDADESIYVAVPDCIIKSAVN